MTSTAASTTVSDAVGTEQLTLLPSLPSPSVSPRFRLSKDTRERGLRHVAEIRRMLAASTDHASRVEPAARHDEAA